MVFKFALVVMVVFLNSATDGKYLLVKLGAKLANKGFEAEPDNRQDNRCRPRHAPCNGLECCSGLKCDAIYWRCEEKPGCFWGANMVHLSSGRQKKISDVKVGDSVLAVDQNGKLLFSQVIMQLHHGPEETTEFHVIRTKTGRNLTLTPTHLIYKAENNKPNLDFDDSTSSQPRFAMNIKKGDFVFVFDKSSGMIIDHVVSNDIEIRKGVYSPLTAHGSIIVEDILASCYAHLEDHSLLHMAFAPARWFNDIRNVFSSMKRMEENASSEYERVDMGQYWYSEALLDIGRNIVPEKLEF